MANKTIDIKDENNNNMYVNSVGLSSESSSNGVIKFGVDANGNYGYVKDGADSVTPFRQASTFDNSVYSLSTNTSSSPVTKMSFTANKRGEITVLSVKYGTDVWIRITVNGSAKLNHHNVTDNSIIFTNVSVQFDVGDVVVVTQWTGDGYLPTGYVQKMIVIRQYY